MSEEKCFELAFATNIIVEIINNKLKQGSWNKINFNNIDSLLLSLNNNINYLLKFLPETLTEFNIILRNRKSNILELWNVNFNFTEKCFNIVPIISIGETELKIIKNTLKYFKIAKDTYEYTLTINNNNDIIGVYVVEIIHEPIPITNNLSNI